MKSLTFLEVTSISGGYNNEMEEQSNGAEHLLTLEAALIGAAVIGVGTAAVIYSDLILTGIGGVLVVAMMAMGDAPNNNRCKSRCW